MPLHTHHTTAPDTCHVTGHTGWQLTAQHMQGAWREVASRTSAFSALNPGSKRRSQEAAWHLLALVKLQMFQKAWELLPDVAQVDDPSHLAEGVWRV